MRLQDDERLPLLGVRAGDVPDRVLVVGDPGRAERAASRLGDVRQLGKVREYHSFVGTHGGRRIGVVSHGVGGPGAAVCFEELCRAGARYLVRAGTAGGLQPDVGAGDLVVATAAIRADGYSDHVVPPAFPAVADHEVLAALLAAAGGAPLCRGIVLTSAAFYPHDVLDGTEGTGALALWQRAGAVAVEMEVASLFVVASLHGAAAGAILAVDGQPARDAEMRSYDPARPGVDEAVEGMLAVALRALVTVGDGGNARMTPSVSG